MIDAIHTITSTFDKALTKLRFQGKNDAKLFRKILSAIILTDMIEWVDFLDLDDETQTLQLKLVEMRNQIFLKNCAFDVKNIGDSFYTSTNLPSSNDQWKLVKDAPVVMTLIKNVTPKTNYTFTPDPNHTPIEVMFFKYKKVVVKEGDKSYTINVPDIDVSKMSNTDKMNIYVDTSKTPYRYWRLDSDCNWKELYTTQEVGNADIQEAVNTVIRNYKVANFNDEGSKLTTELVQDIDAEGRIELATNDDINVLL